MLRSEKKKEIINVYHSESSRGRMNPYHGFICVVYTFPSFFFSSLSLSLFGYATVFNPIEAKLARGKVKYNK